MFITLTRISRFLLNENEAGNKLASYEANKMILRAEDIKFFYDEVRSDSFYNRYGHANKTQLKYTIVETYEKDRFEVVESSDEIQALIDRK